MESPVIRVSYLGTTIWQSYVFYIIYYVCFSHVEGRKILQNHITFTVFNVFCLLSSQPVFSGYLYCPKYPKRKKRIVMGVVTNRQSKRSLDGLLDWNGTLPKPIRIGFFSKANWVLTGINRGTLVHTPVSWGTLTLYYLPPRHYWGEEIRRVDCGLPRYFSSPSHLPPSSFGVSFHHLWPRRPGPVLRDWVPIHGPPGRTRDSKVRPSLNL